MREPLIKHSIKSSWIFNFFKHWKALGIFSKLHWKVIAYWIALSYIIGYLPIHYILHPRKLDNYFLAPSESIPVLIIVCLSFLIIAIGTFMYAFDVFSQTFNADKNIKYLKPLYGISTLTCLACVATCGIGIYTLTLIEDVYKIVATTEEFTQYIFFTLLGIDAIMLLAKLLEISYCKKEKKDEELKQSIVERRFITNQMFLIDIPVLLGVIFISLYVHQADENGFYDIQVSKLDKVSSFHYFKTYFAAGSIGMHIIFSQFIFLILSTKMFYREICKKASEKESSTKDENFKPS